MIGINITKDKYYCCRFFKIQRKKHLKDLKKGYGLCFIREVAEDLEELEKNVIKAKTEELLMKKVKTLTDKKIRFVCYEGRYSNSRTIFINNLKIKRIDNLLEILKKIRIKVKREMRNNPNTRLFLCNIPHKESKEFDSWITEVGQSLLTEASPIKKFIVGQAWGLEFGSAREDNEFKVRMLSKKIKELTN